MKEPASRSLVAANRVAVRRASGSRLALPYIIVNMSMSADGKIATANRAITSFSSRRDHKELLELRATADAVLCGAKTAGAAGVTLGVGGPGYRRIRARRGLAAEHVRAIVSGSGRIDLRAAVFRPATSPLVMLITERTSAARRRALRKVADEVAVFGRRELDLKAAVVWLRKRWGVKRLVCEGGGELNDAMFRAGLVSELRLTICPLVIGGRGAPTLSDGLGFSGLAQAAGFQLKSVRRVGNELYLRLVR